MQNPADHTPEPDPQTETPPARRWPHLRLKHALWGLGTLVLCVIALGLGLVFGLNTAPGRKFIVDVVSRQTFDDGLRVKIGRIDGSLYGRMRLYGLSLSDPKGVFLNIPSATLDWRPFDYLGGRVHVRELSSPDISLTRLPQLKSKPPEPPKGPLLPDLTIDIDQLRLAHVVIGPDIMGPQLKGKPGEMGLVAAAHLKDGEVTLEGDLKSLQGDEAMWGIKSRPDANQLDLSARVTAPKAGVIVALLGLPDGLEARLRGEGNWKSWRGSLMADSVPVKTSPKTRPQVQIPQVLARLSLTARDGQFHIAGPVTPGNFAPESARSLLKPRVDTDVSLRLKDRAAEIKADLVTDAARLEAEGGFDAGKNTFKAFAVTLTLLKPSAVMPQLKGRDIKLDMFLEGPISDLKAEYELKAAAAGWETLSIASLKATGSAALQGKRLSGLVEFGMASVEGVAPEAAALLKSSTGRGDISFDGERLSLKSLKLNSPAIAAKGEYALELKGMAQKGQVEADLKAYDLKDIGRIMGQAKARFSMADKASPRLDADIDLKTLSLSQAALKAQLGGNLALKARINTELSGNIRLQSLTAQAPYLNLKANGVYRRNGTIDAKGDAQSKTYGPLAFTAAGQAMKPLVTLNAARPGLGAGIRDLKAQLGLDFNAAPRIDIKAAAGSDYGPVSADGLVTLGQAISADIRQAEAAGIGFAGRLEQTPQGPFAGALTLNKGLTGRVGLRAQGAFQAADVDIAAKEATLLGDNLNTGALYIGRAIIRGRVVLTDQPQMTGDAQMSDLRYGTLRLQRGRARVNLTGSNGTVQFVGDGEETSTRRGGQSVHMAVNAASAGNIWRINANALINEVPLKLAAPMVLHQEANGWRLEPATLVTDQGQISVAGRFGATTSLEARLKDFDLGLINAIAPSIGVSGLTNGTLTYASDANGQPSGHARLNVEKFSHADLDSVSSLVSMSFEADLAPGARRGTLSSVIRQGQSVIGRIQATVTPSRADAGLDALLDGNIAGGIRYNGPSGPLFSLAGLTGQSLSGPIAVGADISGTVKAPHIEGSVRSDNLTYDNEAFGTRLSELKLEGHFSGDRLDLKRLDGRVGDGTVAVSGWLSLAADQGFPMALKATLNNARLARSDALSSTVTGTLDITRTGPDQGLISGDLTLPQTRYEITPPKLAEVPTLEGVRRKGEQPAARGASVSSLPLFALNVRIRADNQVFLNGMGLQSEWQARLALIGTTRTPRLSGELRTLRGTYDFAGKSFAIDDGVIDFSNGDPLNPSVTLHASTVVKDLTGKITVSGVAQQPSIAFSSSPALPEDEVLSRILFGQSVSTLSATEAIQLASAVNSLRGSGLNPGSKLRTMAGIDRLRVVGADEATGRGTSVAAGKYLTGNIYVEVVTDAKGFMTTQFDIALSRALSLLSQTGSANESSVKLRYSKDY
jgi:translocation and assembly module TamB